MPGRRKDSQTHASLRGSIARSATSYAVRAAATGKNTSAIVKAALRDYEKTLPRQSALEIFGRFGVIGAVSGPRDVSERYKRLIDFSTKHGKP
jgi:hypothetical protein